MSTEGKPGVLSANVAALLQAGAFGLVALLMVGGFKLTTDQVQANRTEAISFRTELEKQRLHDSLERERNRLIVEAMRLEAVRDRKAILVELETLRAVVRKLSKEGGGP